MYIYSFDTLARLSRLCGGAALAIALGAVAHGGELAWKNIQFGGFASQGYLHSSANDYLGETSEGTFDFREYAANASYARGAWRLGAQVFGQKLGTYGDDKLRLDWATVDFQARQWLGFRAGRVKMPRGLYNEALDVDSVRPFVLLPQSVYDARLRDFNASFDGAMAFGNVEVGRAGSIDYRLFYGQISVATDSGAADYFNNELPFPTTAIQMDSVRGGSLFWNTPVIGLRLGYSYSEFKDLSSNRTIFVPTPVGMITLPYLKSAPGYERHLLSAEYIFGDWTFAAEAGTDKALYHTGAAGAGTEYLTDFDSDYCYLSVARRVNRWLELGTYYSYSYDATTFRGPAPIDIPVLSQRDFAVSARFDVNEHLMFKLEGHVIDGAGKLFDTVTHPQPVALRDNSWTMLAAKVTVSF